MNTRLRPNFRRSWRRYGPPLVLGVILLCSWELAVYILGTSSFVLPRPSQIVFALFSKHFNSLTHHAYVTFLEALGGMVLAAASGFVLALALSLSTFVRRAAEPIIAAFQSFPKEAIAPLLIVWFGFGYESKIILAASISFFPIFISCPARRGASRRVRLDT